MYISYTCADCCLNSSRAKRARASVFLLASIRAWTSLILSVSCFLSSTACAHGT